MKQDSSFWRQKTYLRLLILCIVSIGFIHIGHAQTTKTITGKVTDDMNEPIIGANIIIENTTIGTVTDIDGNYSINIPTDGNKKFKVTYIGYLPQTINIGNRTVVNISLIADTKTLDEVVVVGYGTQKKATLTGAVAAVGNKELTVTKNQNTQNMLTGKIPGVRVIQKTSEPGVISNQFDIRGFGTPLVVIDGIPRSETDFARLSPDEIESISVLKDASAAVYGVKAANGVVLVTTKNGEKGRTKIDYSMYYGIQFPGELLKPVGVIDRMTLMNEKTMRSLTNPTQTYSEQQFEEYRTGKRKESDWYAATLRDTAPQQQHNLSISGGSEKCDYFVNMAYTSQDGFFKSGDLNYNRFNLRSNINAQLTKRLKVSVNLNGILDTKNSQRTPAWNIYKTLWRAIPNDPIYANDNPDYFAKPSAENNVVAMSRADVNGFIKNQNKIFQSSVNVTYDIPYIKGLTLKGLFSFDNNIADYTDYRKSYEEYVYDEATDTYTSTTKEGPTKLNRKYSNSTARMWNLSLNYKNTLLEKHNISALLLYEEAKNESDNINATREFAIPLPYLYAGNTEKQVGTADAAGIGEYVTKGIIGKLNYDFANKYILEFNFRYDGSSKFPKNKRWGFFPGVSAGWRLSEEAFIKDKVPFINNLKVRASYGKMGDDGALAYQYLTGYNYPINGARHGNYPSGYMFGDTYINALGFRSVPNLNITWYTVNTANIGIDGDLWNGLLGFSFDIFQRDRNGLLANRVSAIPGSFGASMPQENLNSDRTRGFEMELRHRHKIGKVIYNITGSVSYTRTQNRYVESAIAGNSWDNWRNNMNGRYNDIWFGLGSDGRYTSYEQIATSPIYADNGTLPGDYIYEDWNGDGVIDAMDQHPIATSTNASKSGFQDKRNYPLLNFGLTLSAQYKGFDINLLFQGASKSYLAYGEQLSAPLVWNGNALEMFLDRWRPEDPSKDPYDRSNKWISGKYAYGAKAYDSNSKFGVQNGTYIRLKNVELGYSLPTSLISKVGFKNLRVYVNGYNLLTITGVKGMDPEHPSEQYGYLYPLNKTINFGLNLTY